MGFFELHTPRDMLEKAKREQARLNASFEIDHVFNFFVSAYHITDYLKKTDVVPQAAINQFESDQDIKDCRDLCNKGKHLRLTKGRIDPRAIIWHGTLGGAPVNALPVGGGDKWVMLSGDREVDVEWLMQRVIEKWEAFFSKYGI